MHQAPRYTLLFALAIPLACTGGSGSQDTVDTNAETSTDPSATDTNATDSSDPGDGVCGNAIVDGAEECDDGNALDDDACTTACLDNVCGDGHLYEGVEECDDGNTVATDACTSACLMAACGDGFVQMGVEGCDDGNTADEDGCSSDCLGEACGDGTLQDGEACDDGNQDSTDACTNLCVEASCGDGFVWAGNEECDDANSTQTDSCLNSCVNASCGDGVVWEGTEECDDNNNVDTDDCTNSCDEAICGDGIVHQDDEECDGDQGCSNDCLADHRLVFVSSVLFDGDMGGHNGADFSCTQLANDAGLPGAYMAWLSSADDSPSTRFTHYTQPYELVDGTKVADNWADLTDGTLDAAIDLTEIGGAPPLGDLVKTSFNDPGTQRVVFTNTRPDGTQFNSSFHCTNWFAAQGGFSFFGRTDEASDDWTSWSVGSSINNQSYGGCHHEAPIYCFQQ